MDTALAAAAQRALDAQEHFVFATRADGSEYVDVERTAPTWLREAVRDAHAGHLPDDVIHMRAVGAIQWAAAIIPSMPGTIDEAIAGVSDLAFDCANDLVGEPDTDEALEWLCGAPWRLGYVQGQRDVMDEGDGLDALISFAILTEASEVAEIMLTALFTAQDDNIAPPVAMLTEITPESLIDTLFGSGVTR